MSFKKKTFYDCNESIADNYLSDRIVC